MAELDGRRLGVALLNHPGATGVPGDLRTTWKEVVRKYRAKRGDSPPALLAACPPCQGMSSARSGRGQGEDPKSGARDRRNLLVEVIANVALALKPRIVVVENVPAFLTRKIPAPKTGEAISASAWLCSSLANEYEVFSMLADLAEFGVPQTRRRAFLTFIRRDEKGLSTLALKKRYPYPRPTRTGERGKPKPITFREAFKSLSLPRLDARSSKTAKSRRPLHRVPVWDARRYSMIAAIPANSGSSAWQNSRCTFCNLQAASRDAVCRCGALLPKPVLKAKNGRFRLIHGFRSSSYRRISPKRPAPTITTASGHMGSNFTIHPSQNRVLSPLECAYLQTFPLSFKWGKMVKVGMTPIRDMIGEAVPPLFTRLHGKILRHVLAAKKSLISLASTDPRCARARAKLPKSVVRPSALPLKHRKDAPRKGAGPGLAFPDRARVQSLRS